MPAPASDLQRAPSLAEQIYQRLRFQLRAGTFAPGERLVESSLATRLAVSRSPVREALSRLAADGLLEIRSGGFYIAMPAPQDMAEIFEMRRLLEPTATRQVARAMTPALVNELKALSERAYAADKAGDFAAYTDANYSFRATWVGQVPSRRLRETILRFDDQAGYVRRTTLVHESARAEALALLDRFVAAFQARDEDAAAAATKAFIDGAERHYREIAHTL
jgi:DNA-binding GntR family transcriptional regulator